MESTECIKQYIELIETKYKNKILENKNNGLSYIEINFSDISKFNPELAEQLLNDAEEGIKAIEIAIRSLELGDKVKALLKNLPESTKIPISELTDQMNKFVTVEGVIMKPSDLRTRQTEGKFECNSCGSVINVLMLSHEYRFPSKCSCGYKGRFREISKELEKTMSFEIMEETNPDKKSIKKPTRRKVFLAEPLTKNFEQYNPGTKVIIYGWLELEEQYLKGRMGKQSNEFKTNILANNIIPIERSWSAIKLSKKDKETCQEMAKNEGLLDDFAQSLQPEFEAYNTLRQSLVLQMVGGQYIYNKQGQMKERQCIHIHLAGDPGTGKSSIGKSALRVSPIFGWMSGKGVTGPGATGSVVRDEYGQYVFDAGPVLTNSGGTVMIDEFEKISKEDYGYMANIMAEEVHKINKANIDMEFEAKTSILSLSNPLHGRFIPEDSIIKQFAPIPKFILDRYDVLWAMREDVDQKKIGEKYMNLHMHSDSNAPVYKIHEMQKYIAYARKLICKIEKEESNHFSESFEKLTGKTTEEGKEKSQRLRGNLMRWTYAHCKFTSVGKENDKNEVKVTKNDIDYAFALMRYSFELLELISPDGLVHFEDIEQLPKKKEINKYYLVKGVIKKLNEEISNKGVEFETVVEKCKEENPNITDDDVEKEIEKLKHVGDIFEPRTNKYAMM